MSYVIIGNSAAAIGAIEGIRRVDKNTAIKLVSNEPYHTYSRPLISYYLAGKVTEDKMYYRKQDFYAKNNVETILGVKATGIDVQSKEIALENGEKISYSKLLIATGGTPFIPPMEGLDKENIFNFIKLDDVKAIEATAKPKDKAIIIGAGLIGLKAAEGLHHLGVDVTVVELANRALPAILDEEGAKIVQGRLESKGINFELNTSVTTITGGDKATGVKLQNGRELTADLVIIAVGVRPNTEIVLNTAITVNRGIVIDEQGQTNIQDIYAAGDVAEGYDVVYGQQRILPIWPNAYNQGENAGLNMAGQKSTYKGGFAMNSIGFFGLPMITAGIISPEDNSHEVMIKARADQEVYKKIILKDNKIVGFIFLNHVDRAGILTSFIAQGTDISGFKEALLKDDFGYIHLPKELRIDRLYGGGNLYASNN